MKPLRKNALWIVLAFAAILTVLIFLSVRRKGEAFLSQAREFNYLLITVDTLRADRIGCYGYEGIETPTMDLFAARGVKFENCTATTPLTLPSHTSILTGTYPTFHGVRDNGGFLVPQEMTTLAEVMRGNGYRTSAFISAYVLDSKWGINQGFETYYDNFDLSKFKTISLGQVQRPANEVIDQVLPWLDEHKHEKFFTWVHLYDPHTPYEPPPPYDSLYPSRPYAGEIAYTDSQLARLWKYLEDNRLTENTVLIFAADHGESLGQHQEGTHGFFVYQEGVHVPLIVVSPFEKFRGLSRSAPVSLADIMPTVLDLSGALIPPEVQGKSLLPLFYQDSEKDAGVAYAETFYPRFHFGWSELKSLNDGRYKLIMAPELELYDLKLDPGEQRNLIDSEPGRGREMMHRLEAFIEESGRNAYELDYSHMDEESREKLAALGYIGSYTDSSQLSGRRLGDPKEKIQIFNRLGEARELALQSEFEQVVEIIREIIADDPNVIDAYFTLGNAYFKWRKFEEAMDSFFLVLGKKPDDAFTVINIANCYIHMDRFEEAKQFMLERVNTLSPDSQVYLVLGNIHNFLNEYDEAEVYYKKCIELNPASASAYNALGRIYVIKENLDEARSNLEKAIELNSQLPNVFYHYAQLLEARNDGQGALEAYFKELENAPYNFRASYNVSRLYRLMGREEEEKSYLDKTIEINPQFPLSYFYLARVYLNRGEKYQEAVDMVEKGLELKPEAQDLPLGYFLLADLYNRLGDLERSQHYAEMGKLASAELNK